MRQFFRRLCAVLAPLCLAAEAGIGYYASAVPSAYVVAEGEGLTLPALLTADGVQAADGGVDGYEATLRLLGAFPVKQVAVREIGDAEVILGGEVFGMKMYTSGVLVVGMSDVDADGGNRHPAADAGIQTGDVIESIDGQEVSTKAEVAQAVERSAGRPMTLRVRRDGVAFTVRFAAALSASENRYKAGIWVRDSSAGIGTMTFYLPRDGVFAGLGHPICDVDTGETLPISGGEIVPARIYSITRGVSGDAGELCGGFDGDTCGRLCANVADGVYGTADTLPPEPTLIEIAPRQEVHEGAARIRCTLDSSGPQWYDVEIRRVRYSGGTQDMEIVVTDPALLTRTGGIVQGMSGSPLVQDGRLAGAVTHVLVNDPACGYAIFAETMWETARTVGDEAAAAASSAA